jgi:hypothetical protein
MNGFKYNSWIIRNLIIVTVPFAHILMYYWSKERWYTSCFCWLQVVGEHIRIILPHFHRHHIQIRVHQLRVNAVSGVSQLHMVNVLCSTLLKWTSMTVIIAALITSRCAMATGTSHLSLVCKLFSCCLWCITFTVALTGEVNARTLCLQDDTVAVIASITQ